MPKRKKEVESSKEKVKYKGVIKRGSGRFQAYIYIDGKMQNIGMFDTPKEAARAYDRAAIQAGRPPSKLNFLDQVPKNYQPKKKKLLSTNTIGYRGVCKNGTTGRFKAQIQIGDNYRFIGNFGTTKEAAIAWDLAAIQAKRPISELTFPDINILDTKTKTKKKKTISIKKRKTTKTTLSTTTKSNKSNNSNNSSSCSLDTLATLVSAVPRRRMTNL